MQLVPELEEVRRQALAIESDVESIVSALTPEQLTTRVRPNSWSVSEILVHLRLTVDQCMPPLDKAIEEALSSGLLSKGPFKLGWKGRFFVWYVEPPPKIKLPAPKVLAQLPRMSAEESITAYRQGHFEVMKRLEACNGIDLVRANFRSPFASFITMDLLTIFQVFTSHERRHVWQMRRVCDALAASTKPEASAASSIRNS